jgi:hypothetical protein
LIMHGKLILFKSRGNSLETLISTRLTMFGNFQSLLRQIPLEFSLHRTFKPPWTHLIMHSKLILLKSRGNWHAQLNSKRLTNNFQRLLRLQSMEYSSSRPYQPQWQQVYYSRKLFLLNPRGDTGFIATFQHLTLMKFSCSLVALLWMRWRLITSRIQLPWTGKLCYCLHRLDSSLLSASLNPSDTGITLYSDRFQQPSSNMESSTWTYNRKSARMDTTMINPRDTSVFNTSLDVLHKAIQLDIAYPLKAEITSLFCYEHKNPRYETFSSHLQGILLARQERLQLPPDFTEAIHQVTHLLMTMFGNFQSLLRQIPLEFSLHRTFKPPWTHLIMHSKLLLLKSRGNWHAQLNSKRLTNNFQRILRFQSIEYTSARSYQPQWQQVYYSRKLFLLNPRGHTGFIATFQHLTLMKFPCSLVALLWMPGLHSLTHFNHFGCLSSSVQSNHRWDGNFSINHDQISAFQHLFIQYYGDCWNIVGPHNSTRTLHVTSGHISVQPTTHSISRDSRSTLGQIMTARICLPDTCQQISANISRYIYDG